MDILSYKVGTLPKKGKKLLTICNSLSVKINCKDFLSGTIATTKKGKAMAAGEDLTAQRMARPMVWKNVYRNIRQVFTYLM